MLLALVLALAQSPSAASASAVPPWVVIEPPEFRTGLSLRDVSLCEAPDGALVLAWSRGQQGIGTRLRIARSTDAGRTWERVAELEHVSGATLFAHADHLWLLGVDGPGHRGALVVLRSSDGGRTWTRPEDEHSGLLRGRGEYLSHASCVHVHGDRIHKLFAHWAPSSSTNSNTWGKRLQLFVASAALNADWLESSNWRFSTEVSLAKEEGSLQTDTMLLQPVPSRLIVGVRWRSPSDNQTSRRHSDLRRGSMLGLLVTDDGHRLVDSPADREWNLPMNACGSRDAVDPRTWRHIVLVSEELDVGRDPSAPDFCEALSVYSSQNQKQWELRTILLRDRPRNRFQFSQGAFILKDEDLLAVVCVSELLFQEKGVPQVESLVFLRVPRFRERTKSTPPLFDVQGRFR